MRTSGRGRAPKRRDDISGVVVSSRLFTCAGRWGKLLKNREDSTCSSYFVVPVVVRFRGVAGHIKVMHKGLRVLLASTAALVSLPAFAWLVAEIAAYYEMFSTGMNSRAELGDDLGFGILLFMVMPPFTLAGAAFVWLLVWSRTGRSKIPLSNGDANA